MSADLGGRLRALARGGPVLAPLLLVTVGCSTELPLLRFEDRAAKLGLEFTHFNGMRGRFEFPEIFGSGAALFDYDGDGDLDLYLVQGSYLGGESGDGVLFPPRDAPPRHRLFRNRLREDGRLGFEDVTGAAGLRVESYGMGAAAGDFDGDGHVDLYVTALGDNALLRNRGDGTFVDVTSEAGVEESRWSSSAAFVDVDDDGWLDLYVVNYVHYAEQLDRPCYSATSRREYCGPDAYRPVADRLFRNRGDGTFDDVSRLSGIGAVAAPGLGLVADDFDADGRIDLYVANDGSANQLWMGRGQAGHVRFEEQALLAGCALNEDGRAEAGMGVDAGDYDGDGHPDLFVTHLNDETNTLYRNAGRGWFEDRTHASGLGLASLAFTGFGTAWLDYDRDGWLDLWVANGAVKTLPELVRVGDSYPLHQRNQLFRNRGDGTFDEVRDSGGDPLSEVSRGAAFGDVDDDGDTDIVVLNNNGPVRLLINESPTRHGWIGFELVDERERTVGEARVEITLQEGRLLVRRAHRAASYLSSNDPRVLVGLGSSRRIDRVQVVWPDGLRESYRGLDGGRYHTLRRGASR